eukprot:RCo002994
MDSFDFYSAPKPTPSLRPFANSPPPHPYQFEELPVDYSRDAASDPAPDAFSDSFRSQAPQNPYFRADNHIAGPYVAGYSAESPVTFSAGNPWQIHRSPSFAAYPSHPPPPPEAVPLLPFSVTRPAPGDPYSAAVA